MDHRPFSGDILVSIQGKNVIGIRRTAIERILKQYKVDQEIEIVVCRLKDPAYLLNLTNTSKNKTIIQSQTQSEKNSASASLRSSNLSVNAASGNRSINEQIFNELVSFQDSIDQNSNMKKTCLTLTQNPSPSPSEFQPPQKNHKPKNPKQLTRI